MILKRVFQLHEFDTDALLVGLYLLIRYIIDNAYVLRTRTQWNDPFTLNVIVEYRIVQAKLSCAINIDIRAELQPQF